MPYDEFIRARNLTYSQEVDGRTFRNGRGDSAANLLSASLNQLINLVSEDFSAAEDKELQSLEGIDFRTTEPRAPVDMGPQLDTADNRIQTLSRSAPAVVTARKMQDAVTAFEGRCKSLSNKPIGTAELVRLRALIQIILTHAQPIHGIFQPTQILPAYTKEGYDWLRLIGRLLKQHFGSSRALQQLSVELDEREQQRVIEYLAFAHWAAKAALVAVKTQTGAAFLRVPIERLASSLQVQVNSILSSVPADRIYFDGICLKLEQRFADRLGLNKLSG